MTTLSTSRRPRTRLRGWAGATIVAVCLPLAAPTAHAASDSWCATQLGGNWDAAQGMCALSVTSYQGATMNISVGLPAELMDDGTAGPVLKSYVRELLDGWRKTGQTMVRDNTASATYSLYSSSNSVKSIAYHESFHSQGALANNAYRTFTFDVARGRRLDFADLFAPGIDPLTALPPLARPYLIDALNQASPAHQPDTYPFVPDKWEPHPDGSGFSGNYRAFAITPDELILYMPDAPMTHENPPQTGEFVWSMDGGTTIVHVPRTALKPILRPF